MKTLALSSCVAAAALGSCAFEPTEAGTDPDSVALTSAKAIAPGTYRLVRRGSDKCLDVYGGGTADGTEILQWQCNGSAAQAFRVESLGGDDVRLVNPSSGKCVDVYAAGTADGSNVWLYTCNGTAAQVWRVEDRPEGTVRLRNPNSNRCLDVDGGSNADGADVRIWSCNTADAQRWRVETTGAPPPPPPPPDNPLWRDAVVTAYTFQDNSACNSIMTSTGRPLVPYVSVAIPFRYLRSMGGGPFEIGEQIFVSFLRGRTMPNGRAHTGWVRIDDYCGDWGDDTYCFQMGKPNVDLYVGDWATSGMQCIAADPQQWGSGWFNGPGGDGQEDTQVRFGPAPAGQFVTSYGGRAMGAGNCGDCGFGRTVQPPACWHYDPGSANVEYCSCANSNGRWGECD